MMKHLGRISGAKWRWGGAGYSLVLLALVGCSEPAPASTEHGVCSSDAECLNGQRCFRGACQTSCASDASCPNGYSCTEGACVAPMECTTDAQCLNGFLCVEQRCRAAAACRTDAQCLNGFTCVGARCVMRSTQTSAMGSGGASGVTGSAWNSLSPQGGNGTARDPGAGAARSQGGVSGGFGGAANTLLVTGGTRAQVESSPQGGLSTSGITSGVGRNFGGNLGAGGTRAQAGSTSLGGSSASGGYVGLGGRATGTAGRPSCELGVTNLMDDARLSEDFNWVGGDSTMVEDDPCGFQGAFYAYSDTGADQVAGNADDSLQFPEFVSGNEYRSPCTAGKCCIRGTTSRWPAKDVYTTWGAGIGFSLSDDGNGAGKYAYSGPAKGFEITLQGSITKHVIRFSFTQSATDASPPFVSTTTLGEKTVMFTDPICPMWSNSCLMATDAPYDLRIEVMGGDTAGPFELCVTSLVPISD